MDFLVDTETIKNKFPSLKIRDDIVDGEISFCCFYDKEKDELEYHSSNEKAINDSYTIKIFLNEKDTFGFPKVCEESKKIQEYAKENKLRLSDLHINENNECCLGIFPSYDKENLSEFITDKIIPFFYWQSHRRKYDKEPWAGWSHGDDGIREYLEKVGWDKKKLEKKIGRNNKCPCGSGKKYKKCCLDIHKNL